MEHDIFMGDSSFFRLVQGMADAPLPLVRLEPAGAHAHARRLASLTALGREVLAGRADHARVNGIDRWVGGVHLRGRAPAWRWDAERALVAAYHPVNPVNYATCFGSSTCRSFKIARAAASPVSTAPFMKP